MKRQAVVLVCSRSRDEISGRVLDNLRSQMEYVSCMDKDWDIVYKCIYGFGNITFARNLIVSSALKEYPKAERFILWDDDQIVIGDDGLHKLLLSDKDIIGTLISARWRTKLETSFHPKRELILDIVEGEPVELIPGEMGVVVDFRELTGAGIIMVQRRVFDGMIQKEYVRRLLTHHGYIYDFFCHITVPVEVEGEIRDWLLIEEYAFFTKAWNAGYKIFIDPGIVVGHLGQYIYTLADVFDVEEGHRASVPRYLQIKNGRMRMINEEEMNGIRGNGGCEKQDSN